MKSREPVPADPAESGHGADGPDDRTIEVPGTTSPGLRDTPVVTEATATPAPADRSYRLAPGHVLGPYTIARPLGRGGMGEVYEAIHAVSRHRLALKILPAEHVWSDERTKRFHREGRTAASVNHPHSLYIFGTAEIDGVPVIAMELAPGGTLKDRLDREGPLGVKEAVDAVLQLAEGLQAAAVAGILHRDVKPANCFVDQCGVAKIGDYGLSVPVDTAEFTQITQDGSSLMTPAFASPEQMRGESIDLRADIYSLGATLYNLLTGRTPYLGASLVAMIASVMGSTPTPPTQLRTEIPKGLERVILRCLEKQRENRYADYAALRAALLPFSSEEQDEAGLRDRFRAGFVDRLAEMALAAGFAPLLITEKLLVAGLETVAWIVVTGVAEGIWGRTPGKQVCGLRTIASSGGRVGVLRGLARASAMNLPLGALSVVAAGRPDQQWVLFISSAPVLGLLFLPMILKRRTAPLHDRLSGTRVVRVRTTEQAPGLAHHLPPPWLQTAPAEWKVGPYRADRDPTDADPGARAEGHDDLLRRTAWIRFSAPGAPWVPDSRRDVRRSTRLRWVDGERSETVAWDAFEAVPGQPLRKLLDPGRVSWDLAGRWLDDLGRELTAAAEGCEELPLLDISRLWITESSHLILLDFDPPKSGEAGSRDVPETGPGPGPSDFLRSVATACSEPETGSSQGPRGSRRPAPWPLPVTQCLRGTGASLGRLASDLHRLRGTRGTISRQQRIWHFSLVLAPLVAMVYIGWIGVKIAKTSPARQTARYLKSLAGPAPLLTDTVAVEHRRASGIRLRGLLHTSPDSIPAALAAWPYPQRYRALLDSLRREPIPEETELVWARGELARRSTAEKPKSEKSDGILDSLVASCLLLALLGTLLAAATRGGLLLRALGIAVVRGDGRPAPLGRVLLRSTVTWSPFPLALVAYIGLGHGPFRLLTLIVPAALFLAGTVYALWRPERSIQDRLAGTWLVPR